MDERRVSLITSHDPYQDCDIYGKENEAGQPEGEKGVLSFKLQVICEIQPQSLWGREKKAFYRLLGQYR